MPAIDNIDEEEYDETGQNIPEFGTGVPNEQRGLFD